jgi:NAD(P)-dependent dehydrogenase (short-subunit alcohol dehydrogenase family)
MHQVRVAVVTGGGSGIGRAAALALAADGWTVLLVGRRVAALEAVVADGAQLTGRLLARPADVTDESAVAEVFDGSVAQFGRVICCSTTRACSRPPGTSTRSPWPNGPPWSRST